MAITRPVNRVRKTERMRDLESQHGKPIQDIIAASFQKHGKLQGVATELGVSFQTLSTWLARLGAFWVLAIALPEENGFVISVNPGAGQTVRFID